MVHFTKPAIVATLLIAPALAAPLSQPEQEFSREFEETEFEAREPKVSLRGAAKGIKAVGRVAGKALNHAGNIAMIGSMFGRDIDFNTREIKDTEVEAREPRVSFRGAAKGIKAVGRVAGKALNHAGNIAAIGSMFGRDVEDVEELGARNFDAADLELDARAHGRGFALGGAAFAALLAARPLGESLATIVKRPKNPTFKRGMEDEDEVFGREFDDEMEMLEREYEDALEARSPAVQAKTLLKIGSLLGKHARWVIPTAGAAGVGIG